ncbi:hypothetical protein MES5069_150054 [Mesorhizobium escarrei]|uniref:Uncharacterized protein n=1 Tax=Mesorhizobium escarrei TaxID=666018 RepID=A0ABM9DJS0_9HYPH|nr:hypothetical protein MES5069_150054 [Mesorhizobium escarrei]
MLPPPDLGGGVGVVYGSFGFAIKVSSVDEKYQSTHINAQSLNRFHARDRKRRKQGILRWESFVCKHFTHKTRSDRAKLNLSTVLCWDKPPVIREGIAPNHALPGPQLNRATSRRQ